MHCYNNVWSTAQRKNERELVLDVDVRFERNCGSYVYGKQCLMVWSFVEERGWSHLEKGLKVKERKGE